ncbi:MAG: hypothetical protein NTX34_02370, partial [Cytophagales bacterium]|nr:hypothetical protein [Cytophagales bacterium]
NVFVLVVVFSQHKVSLLGNFYIVFEREFCRKMQIINYLIFHKGSDSSIPFRCQPAGHLAQSLSPFASRIVTLF